MCKALTILSLIGALLCGLISEVSALDYEVKIVRLAKIGERYGLVSTGIQEQHITMIINGQKTPPRDQMMNVALTAKAEVLAVSAGGREMKTIFTVDKLTNNQGAQVTDVLQAGTVIVAEQVGGKTKFQIAGAPAKPEVAEILDLVIRMESDQSTNDDIFFGTKERKKVGDSWPVDAKAGAADLGDKCGLKIDAANISGTTTLVEVLPTGMRIIAKMVMKDVGIPLPPGMAVTSSVFSAEIIDVLPVDTNMRAFSSSMSMEGKIEYAGKSGDNDMTLVTTIKSAGAVTFTAP